MKSELPVYPSKGTKKALREKAKRLGNTFKATAVQDYRRKKQKYISPTGIVRRNPGRNDGATWNCRHYVSPQSIDGKRCHSQNHDGEDSDYEVDVASFPATAHPGGDLILDSLIDIARLARQRGVAKEFEFVQGVRRTFVMDDECDYDEEWFDGSLEDDEWEEIYGDEREKRTRKSYAAVLKER